MDWIIDHFKFVFIGGVLLASWLKSRADRKNAEEEERQAREIIGEFPLPLPPNQPASPPPLAPSLPPPLKPATLAPASGPAFSGDDMVLKHQLEILEQLQQAKIAKATTTGGALATRNRIAGNTHSPLSLPRLSATLKDPQQTRRAIILREVLSPPLALR